MYLADNARFSYLFLVGISLRADHMVLPMANLLESRVDVLLEATQLVEVQTVQILAHPLPNLCAQTTIDVLEMAQRALHILILLDP